MSGMALWDRVSEWLDPSLPGIYRCVECDTQFGDRADTCPECGGSVEEDQTIAYHYWGPF